MAAAHALSPAHNRLLTLLRKADGSGFDRPCCRFSLCSGVRMRPFVVPGFARTKHGAVLRRILTSIRFQLMAGRNRLKRCAGLRPPQSDGEGAQTGGPSAGLFCWSLNYRKTPV
jgi:hypothetical protein